MIIGAGTLVPNARSGFANLIKVKVCSEPSRLRRRWVLVEYPEA